MLIAAAVAVFAYIRRRFYEYTYIINGDIITVKLKIGSKETTECQLRLKDIVKVTFDAKMSALKKDDGVKTFLRCNGDLFGTAGTCIVFSEPEKEGACALIFRPSAKFTEILQNQRIDIGDKL